jgi:rhodanese-related sulfurtransferase
MDSFIKSNRLWLGLLGVALVIVLLAFLFKPKSIEFQTKAKQSVTLISDKTLEVSVANLTGKQLIDIRPADQFAQGHAEMAINIPVRNLLDEESLEIIERLQTGGQEAVLYGTDELQSVAPCLLLQQMGYTKVKFLKGGFGADNKLFETTGAATETMQLDQAAMKAVQPAAAKEPEKKKPQVVIPVRKEASSGGGC